MIDKQHKVEVKYESPFSIFITRVLSISKSIIKPLIALLIVLVGLYIAGYIILIFILVLTAIFIYKKIKSII